METRSADERRRIVRAALIAFFAGLAPTSVPFWATEASNPVKAAFVAAGLACWAVALLVWDGMDVPRSPVGRRAQKAGDEDFYSDR